MRKQNKNKKKEHPKVKLRLHIRNKHRERYNFKELIETCPDLSSFVKLNAYNDESIDFSDPNNIVVNHFETIGTIVNGAVGFNASGAVNGNTFNATNISAVDGIIQGSVDGAFFNVAGDVVAGVADIVKTGFKLSSSQGGDIAYDSTKLRYENAQHVSTFVAAQEPVSSGP